MYRLSYSSRLILACKWRNTICISIIKLVYAYVQFNPLLHYQNRFYGINKLYIKQLQVIIKNNPSIILVHVYTSICYIQSQLLGLRKKTTKCFPSSIGKTREVAIVCIFLSIYKEVNIMWTWILSLSSTHIKHKTWIRDQINKTNVR